MEFGSTDKMIAQLENRTACETPIRRAKRTTLANLATCLHRPGHIIYPTACDRQDSRSRRKRAFQSLKSNLTQASSLTHLILTKDIHPIIRSDSIHSNSNLNLSDCLSLPPYSVHCHSSKYVVHDIRTGALQRGRTGRLHWRRHIRLRQASCGQCDRSLESHVQWSKPHLFRSRSGELLSRRPVPDHRRVSRSGRLGPLL